jgi:hypothetical protein
MTAADHVHTVVHVPGICSYDNLRGDGETLYFLAAWTLAGLG